MLNLDATSDFKTKVDIGLSFSYKTHAGNVRIKVEKPFMSLYVVIIALCEVDARN